MSERNWSHKSSVSRAASYYIKIRSSTKEIAPTTNEDLYAYCPIHDNVYNSFVPLSIDECNFSGNTAIAPKKVNFYGCCMLTDISGFTKLSSKLCDEGIAGLDTLRHSTNDFLARIVNTVYSFGGDVLFFAGDALISVFKKADSSLPNNDQVDCCYRALTCATNINDCESDDFQVHTAISYGDLQLCVLGGYDSQWSYLIGGECVTDLSQCIEDAAARETVVTRAVYERLPHHMLDAEYLPSGMFRVSHRPSSRSPKQSVTCKKIVQKQYLSFIPRPVLAAISTGTLDNLAELRNITTLFMKLDSYSPTEHKDLTSLQPFYHAMQEIIYECGGYIRQFIIDDKGCVLIVLWGVPTASFPNNCSRAVRCAAAMAAKTTSLNHACSIGITTGTAYCGTVGSSRRQDYVAMGSSVNLSARLMIRASGRIIIDDVTQEYLPIGISSSMTPLPPMSLKGLDYRMCCYCYTSPTTPSIHLDRQLWRDIILSRDASLVLSKAVESVKRLSEQLTTHSSSFCGSHTEYVFISGCSGLGKTTLAKHFVRRLVHENLKHIFIPLTKANENDPYVALRLIFLAIIGEDNFREVEDQKSVIMDILKNCFADENMYELTTERFPIIKTILKLEWQLGRHITRPGSTDVNSKFDGNNTFIDIIQHLVMKHNVKAIVIDNAHYMCTYVWNHLPYFAMNNIPLVILATVAEEMRKNIVISKSEEDSSIIPSIRHRSSSPTSLNRPSSSTKVTDSRTVKQSQPSLIINYLSDIASTQLLYLRPMSMNGVKALIEASLSQATVSPEITASIYNITRGNPFWVSELAKVIAECGIEAFAKLVSKGIEQNLLATCILSRYTTAQCSVIKMASVLGEEFRYVILFHIVSYELQANLLETLAALTSAGMLYRVSDDIYRFQSPLISDLIYGLIPPSNASALHFEVAKTIEANYLDDLSDHVSALAYHYSMSPKDNKPLAYKYAIAAAKQCSTQFDFQHIFCYLDLAAKVGKTSSQIAEIKKCIDQNIALIDFVCQSGNQKRKAGLQLCYQQLATLKDKLIMKEEQNERSCWCFELTWW